MDKDNREKTCIPSQTQSSRSTFMDCFDQIHKLDEDFTQSLGNTTLIIPQDWLSLSRQAKWGRRKAHQRKERTVTEVKTGARERKLTADNLSDRLVGYRRKGWSTRERERERQWQKERRKGCVRVCVGGRVSKKWTQNPIMLQILRITSSSDLQLSLYHLSR